MFAKGMFRKAAIIAMCAPLTWAAADAADGERIPALYYDLDGDGRISLEELKAVSPLSYPVVDTGQAACFDDAEQITCPESGAVWFGQDAQYQGNQPSYSLGGNGSTVYDDVTGLTWQQIADTNGDRYRLLRFRLRRGQGGPQRENPLNSGLDRP